MWTDDDDRVPLARLKLTLISPTPDELVELLRRVDGEQAHRLN